MKVLLATDGSAYSEKAVKEFCRFFRPAESSAIRIVSAVETAKPAAAEPFGVSAEYYLKMDDLAKKQAAEFIDRAEQILRDNLAAETDVEIDRAVLMSAPKTAITEEAESWGADLIVVGSHGYGFWERMLLGSVSDAVIHHAPCSVLVIRDSGPEEKE